VPNPEHNPDGDFALKKSRVLNDGNEKFTFSGIGYYSPKLFDGLKAEKNALAPLLGEAIEKIRIISNFINIRLINNRC